MDDLWQIAGGLCSVIETAGATGHPVHTKITNSGVAVGELSELDNNEAQSRSQEAQTRRCWCCAGRESARSLRASGSEFLRFEDLLGAVLDPVARLVRLVHCPIISGTRARRDVFLHIGGGEKVLEAVREWASQVNDRCTTKGLRRYHVLINPASGSGNAASTWQQVRELFACLPFLEITETHTTRAGEACEIASQLDPNQCDGIIVISGDGMVHEVFNGLAHRSDRGEALRIAVGHIPGGSGNALAKSILHSSGEAFGALEAAFLIAKGKQREVDLMTVSQPNQPDRISFLGLSAGVIADVDLGSEWLRFMGGFRFTLYAAVCIAYPRPLVAELHYWPATSEAPAGPAPGLDSELPPGPWVSISGAFTIFWSANMAWMSYKVHLAPGQCMGDGTCSLVILRDAGRLALTQFLLALESDSGTHLDVQGAEKLECKAFRLVPAASVRGYFSLDGEEVPLQPIQFWPTGQGRVIGSSPDSRMDSVMNV
ncbi:SPHK1 [Symbiodinium natans]|uniref:SPHK1 protein n=1 Tax=Symbiodinium natans TaxID=878477 RepID=A0A812RPW1_9DINO|nr:SPHK1 [Symbiodinium natans]